MEPHTDQFERSRRNTGLFINGVQADPLEVEASLGSPDRLSVDIHLDLGVVSTVHELQQAGVQVSETSLPEFLVQDIREHGDVALTAYLELAWAAKNQGRAIPKPKHKAKWRWIQLSDARRNGVVVTLSGRGAEVS